MRAEKLGQGQVPGPQIRLGGDRALEAVDGLQLLELELGGERGGGSARRGGGRRRGRRRRGRLGFLRPGPALQEQAFRIGRTLQPRQGSVRLALRQELPRLR